MHLEQFHNRLIEKLKPSCLHCQSRCYRGEGFASSVEGKIVFFCSHSCLEDWQDLGNEDDDIFCSNPTEEMLQKTIEKYLGNHIPTFKKKK